MIHLKSYQEKAVKGLLENILEQLGTPGRRKKLVFKAPTGSGKTVTTAAFLARLVETLPQQTVIRRTQAAFIWLAPFKLHEQSFRAFQSFFAETRLLRPIKFEDVQDGRLQPNDVLFVNWESVNKDSNRYIREDERDQTLHRYVQRAIGDDTEVIIILDEAHLFASKGKRATELLDKLQAKIELDVSATPEFSSDYQTIIKRKEVVEAEMIKRHVLLNPDIEAHTGLTAQEGLLDEALQKRAALRDAYTALGIDINPLLLIQLPNDRAELSQEDQKIRDTVVNRLGIEHNISTQNGRLAVWLSDAKDKINLDGIEAPNAHVDVLLFKQAVSLGWDCPRAAILLIFRELKRETFTIQTVGRILRMPEQKHYPNEMLNVGYVYTDLSKDMIKVVADDMDYIVQQRALRKSPYEVLQLEAHRILNIRPERNRLGSKFKRIFLQTCEETYEISPAQHAEEYENNLQQLEKRLIRTNVRELEVHLPKDVELSGDIESKQVEKTLDVAKTAGELRPMFIRFCAQNTGNYAPADSTDVLSGALLTMGEVYFGFSAGSGEFKTMKLILFEENKDKFVALIDKALDRYAKFMEQQAAQKERKPEAYAWDVPVERIYNEYYEEQKSETHILTPLFVEKNASNPEVHFIEFLERHAEVIEWWYKNGVKTQNDFAVSYRNYKNQWSAFYVDFVIKLKNGTVALFDTKTLNSEPDFVAKHNALHQYIQDKRDQGKKMIGGVIVPEKKGDVRLWKYCENRIDNAHDTTGWVTLDLITL
ncbi:restriction endonuclease subunit R [Runella rosea]|uniref:Restriction endonuclease subunit R n=1 Tax=Runella rosea TaxID=2259595 RepID=A0A344TQG3_9BACT|nr:DEAD/DEAH box helicase family protein [Runella rosea]AXE20884.1 restriction endonuclease subunit R [Runella rosea]